MAELRYSTHQITEEDIAAVVGVLRSDWLTQGPMVERFEAALCEYTGAKYAVCVSSGTAALHLAYLALDVPAEAHVVTSPLTFVATANAALLAGFTVSFEDVDPATGNMARATLECDAIVPVHFAGRACPMPAHGGTGLSPDVIEDACHALGAMDFDGCSRVGSCAHSLATCFSFHPVKPITTGEGGAVTTNDQGFADEVRSLRSHGRDAQGRMTNLGLNYRMTELQAALGLSQLQRCDEMRERRCRLAGDYDMKLSADDHVIHVPCRHAHHLYPIRIKNGRRDEIKAKLNAQGIGAQVHYIPVHEQPYYAERFGYKPEDFPEAHAWGQEELSLPLHAKMTEADVQRVVDALQEALR